MGNPTQNREKHRNVHALALLLLPNKYANNIKSGRRTNREGMWTVREEGGDLQTGKQINKRQANTPRCDCRTFAQKGKTIEFN